MAPKVSVLVSTFNAERFIRQTLDSILAQTFRDFEVVVVDDGSKDGTCALVEATRDPRIRLIRKVHSGIPDTYNRAVEEARGEYLARIGHDDLMDPHRLELQVAALERHPEVGVVHTDADILDAHGRHTGAWTTRDYGPAEITQLFFRFRNEVIDPSTMVRKQVYHDVGGYDLAFAMCNDYDFWIRASAKWRFLHLPLRLTQYRRHGGNFSDERNKEVEQREVGFILGRMATIFRTLRELVPEAPWNGPEGEEVARAIARDILSGRGYADLGTRLFGGGLEAQETVAPLRIFMVMFGWADSGGGTILPRAVAKALVRRGHEVMVFYAGVQPIPGAPAYHVERRIEDGVRLWGVFNRPSVFMDLQSPEREIRDDAILEQFCAALDEFRPDAIHIHNLHNLGAALAVEVGRRGLRGYMTAHNYWLVCPRLYLFQNDYTLCYGPGDGKRCAPCVGRPDASEAFAERRREMQRAFNSSGMTCLAVSDTVRQVLVSNGFDEARIQVLYQGHAQADRLWREVGANRVPARPDGDVVFSYIGSSLPHKGVHLLVTAAQKVEGRFQVRVYGDVSPAFLDELRQRDHRGVVQFRGAYSFDELPDILRETHVAVIPSIWYDNAPLAVSECLAARVPVLGANMGGIPELLKNGRTGYLFDGLRDDDLTYRMQEVVAFPDSVAEWQANIQEPLRFDTYVGTLERLYFGEDVSAPVVDRPITVAWEGTQFVYHSLAGINRHVCTRLLERKDVELTVIPFEGPQFDPRCVPKYRDLLRAHNQPRRAPPMVHVRHTYPPVLEPPPSGRWVMIQPWEYGGLPAEWLKTMKHSVDEIWVPSNWVRDGFVKSGVPADRVVVVPNGVDTALFRPDGPRRALPTAKAYKFLFLGGTLHRKGIDVAIDAYLAAFKSTDDVCLVIKAAGGKAFYSEFSLKPRLDEIWADPNAPEVVYLDDDLTEEEVAALYRAVDCLVHPYRGEGFGMPISEAMATGLPVVVSGYGACLDFCDEETAYLIPATEVAVHDEWLPEGSIGYWGAEPDKVALALLLRKIKGDPEAARTVGRKARDRIAAEFGWERVTTLYSERIAAVAKRSPLRFSPEYVDPAVFYPEVEPLNIDGLHGLAILCRPDFRDDAWISGLEAYLREFKPADDVVLILRADPAAAGVEERIVKVLAALGHDPERIPDVLVVDTPIMPAREGGLYTACSVFLDLGHARHAREARAAGLAIAHPGDSLRAMLPAGVQ